MLADKLADLYGFTFSKRLFNSVIAEGNPGFLPLLSIENERKINSEKIIIIKPQTYMNLSGESVSSLRGWYKVDFKDILVICDDFSLPLGTLRFKTKGRDGGHNGLKSIISLLGTDDFPRLRIGVGKPSDEMDCADYVLSKITDSDMKTYNYILDRGADGISFFITEGIDKSMNLFNKEFMP
jgi:PTH1 family peptidyl-tRNA hydrolase